MTTRFGGEGQADPPAPPPIDRASGLGVHRDSATAADDLLAELVPWLNSSTSAT